MSRPVRFDHTRTGRLVLAGLWADAGLVMAASAWNGGRALQILGDPFWAGVLLGLAVDVGLAVALIGDRALHLAGRVEHWGRALRITTAMMSLGLNCAVAAYLGQWGLVVFHAFLPLLLILLSEYSQSSTLQFRDIADERAAAEKAARDAQLAAEQATYEAQQRERRDVERQRANGVLVDAEDYLRKAAELRRQAEQERAVAQQERAATDAALTATQRAQQRLSRAQQKASPVRNKTAAASREERREWVRQERAAGRQPTGAEVDKRFGPPRTGVAIVAEVDNELRRAVVHAVRSDR